MRLENMLVVLKREYLQRVKTKGFWIATLALPLFIGAMTLLPALLMSKSKTSQNIVVVDETGRLGAELKRRLASRQGQKMNEERGMAVDESKMARFDVTLQEPAANRQQQKEALDRRVLDKEIDAWVWISPKVLDGEKVEYHARSVSNVFTQDALEDDLSWVVRRERFQQAGIDPARMDELSKSVKLATQKVSAKGTRAEAGIGGMMLGVVLFLMLYMSILIWGQQVMTSVLEEKGSRVIEVLISSITPFELMMGKLLGVCLVGMTQIGIWLATMGVISAPGVAASIALLPKDSDLPQLAIPMLFHFGLLFILGFFAYATIYAAIGSAFNNLQEAQQAASVAVIFVVIPVTVMYPVINDPNSTMATVLSLIPMFTPLLMPLRIAIEMPPWWQLALAYALTIGFVIGMVWFCSKIYRVGILMYGKKPTFQEIWKWTRYA
ncbi:MAG TPA: ABC transporter permease [Thermoanaerobaculia bacterium]|nr:ABC transporter permease [Thermoanaerobaculia bacterium]